MRVETNIQTEDAVGIIAGIIADESERECGLNEHIRKMLEELAEPKFQKFSSSLIPNIPSESVLGVRLPALRKIAKRIAKSDWRSYLADARDDSFEEIVLQGMVIGYAKAELPEVQQYITEFVPKINNWSVCDSFCSGLKVARAHPLEMWEFIMPYVKSDKEYEIRFGIVMMLFYYIDETHISEALNLLDAVRHESYYVKMAAAWAISIYYVSFPVETLEYLKRCKLDDFTYNKALQKIIESRQVDDDTKKRIRSMKRI